MKSLAYVLAAEGPSDDMLLPIIDWVLGRALGSAAVFNGRMWPCSSMRQRIEQAVTEFADTELLLVHADADSRTGYAERVAEINSAVHDLREAGLALPPHVCIVPVRESEAWLLFDERAIRYAARKVNGKERWKFPSHKYDEIADPKRELNTALDIASELTGRRLAKFRQNRQPLDVAKGIEDFSPLLKLDAFRAFHEDIAVFAREWLTGLD
jgi:hypothetical protein